MKTLNQETHYMEDFSFDVHIFKEGDSFVAYVPALDLSSCGATDDEARRNIRDAVRGFLATSANMGTLDEILQEAGYEREGDQWRAPEFVSVDRLTMSIK
jgi:predicted RNase H-like HicB family nuclease